jgi:hypothetical protein
VIIADFILTCYAYGTLIMVYPPRHLLHPKQRDGIFHRRDSIRCPRLLEQNNLPRGLLPLGVKSYVLHEGTIEVTLPGECNFFAPIGGDQ